MNSASSTQSTQGYNPERGDNQGSAEGDQDITDRFAELAKDLQGQEALDAQRDNLNELPVTQGDNVAHTADQDRRDGETADTASQVDSNTPPETAHGEKAPGAPNAFDTFHAKDSLPNAQKPDLPEGHDNEAISPLTGNAGNTVEGPTKRFDGSGTSADHHLPRAEAGHPVQELQRSPIDGSEVNGAYTIDYERTDNETDDPETPADSVEGAQDNSEQGRNGEIAKQTAEMAEIIEKIRDRMKSELKTIASQFESADTSLRELDGYLRQQDDVDESLIGMVGRARREAHVSTKAMHDQIAQFDQQTLNNLSEGSVNELISDMMQNSTDGKGIDGKKIEKTVFDTIDGFNKLFSEKLSQLDKTVETIRGIGYGQVNSDILLRIDKTVQDMDNHKLAVESTKNALRSHLELSGQGLSDKIRALNSTMIAPKQAPEANEPEPKTAAGDEPPERRDDNSDDRTPEDYI